MRGLELQDSFLLSRIIDKADLDVDLNSFLDDLQGKSAEYAGGKLFLLIGKSWHKSEKEILQLLSDLTGDEVAVVKKYKVKKLKEVFTEIVKDEEFASFFNLAEEETK